MKSVRAKKKLGQHFLKDLNIARKISETLTFENYKKVIEIGPGMGVLTQFLIEKTKDLNLIEIDSDSAAYLKNHYEEKDFNLIEGDFLKLDIEKTFGSEPLAIIGNFPYNISTQIIFKTLEHRNQIPFFSGMFQKEVAERILANVNTSNYGRLAILAKWKLDIKKICDIKPSSFSPKPKIESSLLFFTPKKKFLRIDKPKNIELITRIFFNHRRKMIKKPFNQLFKGNIEIQKKLMLNLNLRPQNLDFATYYNLAKEYENLRS